MLSKSFWVDDIYQNFIVNPVIWLSGQLRRLDKSVIDGAVRGIGWVGAKISAFMARFDRNAIDGAVDGMGDGVVASGRQVRKIETGNVQTYLLLLFASIIILVLLFAR